MSKLKIAFYLAHPAHYHLFKNVINRLAHKGCKILVLYNEKDVLHHLTAKLDTKTIKIQRVSALKTVNNGLTLKIQFAQKTFGAFWRLLLFQPMLVVGTPVLIALIGRLLKYSSIIVNEDDFDVIKQTAELGYPYATTIVCPDVCRTGRFDNKSLKYAGYHELAYLHPNHFTPDPSILRKYNIEPAKPYVVIRFAKLSAHHDRGVRGINLSMANKMITILKEKMNVIVSAEREIDASLERFRLTIDPTDMHHIMAFASLYVGDSQTMAAEAGVLGVPFIRYNDFVGKIGYLNDLENKYQLGFGVSPGNPEQLIQRIEEVLNTPDCKNSFQERRNSMLKEKIDTASFLTWLIENYPNSAKVMKEKPDTQLMFK